MKSRFRSTFQGVSSRFGLRTIENSSCHFLYILCSPNEDFGRPDELFRMRFRSTFQGCEYCNFGYKTLKNASKPRSEKFFLPSKIFVWEGYICMGFPAKIIALLLYSILIYFFIPFSTDAPCGDQKLRDFATT